jgi:hypothetical protein
LGALKYQDCRYTWSSQEKEEGKKKKLKHSFLVGHVDAKRGNAIYVAASARNP